MDKQSLYDKLKKDKLNIVVIDNILLDPSEIFLLTDKSRDCISFPEGNPLFVIEDGRKRYIRVISFGSFGIRSWDGYIKNGRADKQGLIFMPEEDSDAFFLYYAYLYAPVFGNWLKRNIITGLLRKYSLPGESDLVKLLAGFIDRRKISFRVRNIVDIPDVLYTSMKPYSKAAYSIGQFRLKVFRRLQLRTLTVRDICHHLFMRRRYLKYLTGQKVLNSTWTKLEGAAGSTSSLLIKQTENGRDYLIKGNDASICNGLWGEIEARNNLKSKNEDADGFLELTEYDENRKWVKFPFADNETLDVKTEGQTLSQAQLERLGAFLCGALDRMKAAEVVHNDLRPDNIMFEEKEGAMDFFLIDFGCAVVNGCSPWDTKKYWGRYMTRIVCGKYRYNEIIVDDAAAAYQIYLDAGGGSDDSFAKELYDRIGRYYFLADI